MNIQQRTRYVIDDNTPFGGFWRRFVALFIDNIILIIPSLIISVLVQFTFGGPMYGSEFGNPEDLESIDFFIQVPLFWLYYAILTSSSWQATVGKKLMGLKVVDDNGERISFGRATGRYFAKIPSGLILCIGFLMVAWTNRKRGLHDMIAGTLVVQDHAKTR